MIIGNFSLGHGQAVKASDSDSETESSNLSGPAILGEVPKWL